MLTYVAELFRECPVAHRQQRRDSPRSHKVNSPLKKCCVEICASTRVRVPVGIALDEQLRVCVWRIPENEVITRFFRYPDETHSCGKLFSIQPQPEVLLAGVVPQELLQLVEQRLPDLRGTPPPLRCPSLAPEFELCARRQAALMVR